MIQQPVFRLILWLPALALAACVSKPLSPSDGFSAYNVGGGANRANDYSRGDAVAVTGLAPVVLDSAAIDGILGQPLILPGDRSALLLQDGTLALLSHDSITHRARFPDGVHPVPGLAADSAGTIYAAGTNGDVFAFDTNGRILWTQHPAMQTDDTVPDGLRKRYVVPSLPLALQSGVVIGSSDGELKRLARDGTLVWRTGCGVGLTTVIAADPAVGIVAGLTHDDYDRSDTVASFDPATGRRRWSAPTAGLRIVCGPAIIGNAVILGASSRDATGGHHPVLLALGPDGRMLWNKPMPVIPRGLAGDGDGNIYVSGSGTRRDFSGGAITSLTSTGARRWEVFLESPIPGSPAVTHSWVYFVSRRRGRMGLYTYTREGAYNSFVPVTILPEVSPQITITQSGLMLAVTERAMLLRGE